MSNDRQGEIQYLAGARTFASRDLDEIRTHVSTLLNPHTIRTSGAVIADTIVSHRPTDAGSLIYLSYGSAVEVFPGELSELYLLQIACSGTGTMRYGNHAVELDPAMSAAFLSPHRPVCARFDGGTQMLIVKTDRAQLEAHYAQHLGYHPDNPLEFDPHVRLDCAGGAQIAGLARILATTTDAVLERLLMTALIYVQPNSWRHQLLRVLPAAQPKAVRLAQEYVSENYADDVTIEDIAAAACVSARALFVAFRHSLGVTPMVYLRDFRLERIRADLRSTATEAVTSVAARNGITHMGRFAADYRHKFGERPSETRRA